MVNTLELGTHETVFLQKQSAKHAVAIFHHAGEDIMTRPLNEALDSTIMCWNRAEFGRISILSVTNAKGWAFDLAVVISKAMVDNKKYFAYTRTAKQLIVVKSKSCADILHLILKK